MIFKDIITDDLSCVMISWYYDLGKEKFYSSILKKTNFCEVQCS